MGEAVSSETVVVIADLRGTTTSGREPETALYNNSLKYKLNYCRIEEKMKYFLVVTEENS